MSRYKQSSLYEKFPMNSLAKNSRSGPCQQRSPCFFVGRVFGFHTFGGCGASNLSFPIGGAAKGTPKNLLTDLNGAETFKYEAVRPSTFPYLVDTSTAGDRGKNTQNIDKAVRKVVNMFLFNS